MNKKLLAALIALSMVGVYACDSDDDGGKCEDRCEGNVAIKCINGTEVKNDCATTNKMCSAGTCVDNANCDTAAKLVECAAAGKDLDPASCSCKDKGQACDTAAKTAECTATGKAFDSASCTCKDIPQGCDATAKAAECTAAGKDFDVANCACKDKQQSTCDVAAKTAECTAAGKDFDAASCSCKDKGQTDPSKPTVGGSCDPATYPGACVGDKGYYCGNDNTIKEKDCAGCAVNQDKVNSVSCGGSGETCTKETYPGGCSADGLTGTYCGNKGTVVTVTCTADKPCNDNNGYISCQSGATVDCAPGGTEYCNKVCKPDKSEGYYYSQGEVKTQKCPNNDCNVANNRVNCGEGGGTTTDCTGKLANGGNVGDPCERDCYTQTCINDGANALVCWDNVVTQWKCASTCQDAGYNPSKPLQVNCPNSGGGTTTDCTGKLANGGNVGDPCERDCYTQTCTNGGANALVCWNDVVTQWNCASTCQDAGYDPSKPLQVNCPNSGGGTEEPCTKESYTPECTDDANGSYCGNKGTVVKVSCTAPEKCNNNNGYISCKEDGGKCTYGSYESKCDGDVALYCQRNGDVGKKTCNAGQCLQCPDGYVTCNPDGKTCANIDATQDHSTACTGDTKLTTGGTEGACCDLVNYMPSCNGTNVTYCSSVGKVKSKACAGCSVNESTKEYTCAN